jgi:putative membrane protein
MLRPFIRTALALFTLSWFLPTVSFSDWIALIFASIILTLLYSLIRPLLKIILLPINFVTLGMASALVNVGLLWLATYLVPGFYIEPMLIFGIYINEFFALVLVSILIGFLSSAVKVLI